MKELSIVYTVSEFVPLIQKLLKGKNLNKNVCKIYDILRKITKCESAADMAKCLNSDASKMMQFQNEVFDMILYSEVVVSESAPRSTGGLQSLAMVVFVSVALLGCLFFMIYNGDKLSGEGISIISSVAGIFGACLKDAFSAVFGTQNQENNTKFLNK